MTYTKKRLEELAALEKEFGVKYDFDKQPSPDDLPDIDYTTGWPLKYADGDYRFYAYSIEEDYPHLKREKLLEDDRNQQAAYLEDDRDYLKDDRVVQAGDTFEWDGNGTPPDENGQLWRTVLGKKVQFTVGKSVKEAYLKAGLTEDGKRPEDDRDRPVLEARPYSSAEIEIAKDRYAEKAAKLAGLYKERRELEAAGAGEDELGRNLGAIKWEESLLRGDLRAFNENGIKEIGGVPVADSIKAIRESPDDFAGGPGKSKEEHGPEEPSPEPKQEKPKPEPKPKRTPKPKKDGGPVSMRREFEPSTLKVTAAQKRAMEKRHPQMMRDRKTMLKKFNDAYFANMTKNLAPLNAAEKREYRKIESRLAKLHVPVKMTMKYSGSMHGLKAATEALEHIPSYVQRRVKGIAFTNVKAIMGGGFWDPGGSSNRPNRGRVVLKLASNNDKRRMSFNARHEFAHAVWATRYTDEFKAEFSRRVRELRPLTHYNQKYVLDPDISKEAKYMNYLHANEIHSEYMSIVNRLKTESLEDAMAVAPFNMEAFKAIDYIYREMAGDPDWSTWDENEPLRSGTLW